MLGFLDASPFDILLAFLVLSFEASILYLVSVKIPREMAAAEERAVVRTNQLLGAMVQLLEGWAQQSAGQLVSNLGRGSVSEKHMLETEGAVALVSVLQQVGLDQTQAELVATTAAKTALGRKAMKVALARLNSEDGPNVEAALQALGPWINAALGGLNVTKKGAASRAPDSW